MNKGVRVANYIVDIIVITIVTTILKAFTPDNSILSILVMPMVSFLYYFLFETITGQTVGKMITKTVVVDLQNNKPHIFRIFLRTLMRFNPIDSFSYLYGQEQGSHDILSRTRLKFKKDV